MKPSKKAAIPASPRRRPTVRRSRVPTPQRAILFKMRDLPPDKIAQVGDFIDFLRQRQDDRRLTTAATKIAEKAFGNAIRNRHLYRVGRSATAGGGTR